MTARPEILVIISHYLPGFRAGGPIRTTSNMVHWMGDDFNFKILTSDRDLGADEPYPNINAGCWQPVGKASVRYLTPHELSLGHLRHVINQTSHDMIYLDAVFPSISLKTLLLRKLRLIPRKPIIIVPRGMLNPGALSLKTTKKQTFLRLARWTGLYAGMYWHASSAAERNDLLRELHFKHDNHIRVISNLPSQLLLDHTSRQTCKKPGAVRVVFLSRISRKKNLHFALELLKHVKGRIQFDIYGPLEDASYWQKCVDIVTQLPAEIQVSYRGEIVFDGAVNTLAKYHLMLFPTLGENFGHVILESLCAGCPVLISDQTPWSNVTETGAGWAFPLDSPAQFIATLQNMVELDEDNFLILAKRAYAHGKAYVENPVLVNQMQQFFHQVLETRRNKV